MNKALLVIGKLPVNKGGIYQIVNVSKERYYIGSTKNFQQRFKEHKEMLAGNRHHNQYLQNDFNNTHGEFLFEILEICKTPELGLIREQIWLDKIYDDQDQCYNMCPKVQDVTGRKHSQETKEKMSKAHKGKRFSDKTRKKISKAKKEQTHLHFKSGKNNPMFGKHGEKHHFFGKGHSQASKDKMSTNSRGIPNFKNGKMVGQFDLESGELIRTYSSASEAQRVIGIQGVYKVVSKKGKSTGGFGWKYITSIKDMTTKFIVEKNKKGFHKKHTKESIKLMRLHPKRKKVGQFNKNTGDLIEIFESTMEIQRLLGIHNSMIGRCCLGKRKTVYGFMWKYL